LAEPPLAEQIINTGTTTGPINALGSITAGSGYVGPIATLGAITAGTLYTTGTYNGVALTGGTGSGATANITVAGGGVTAVTLVNKGTGYVVADALSATAASIGGTGSGFSIPVATIVPTVYPAQALTGGTGSGATADITVGSGGTVTTVVLKNRGTGYTASDSLGAALDGVGSGFAVAVTSVTERITFGPTTNFVEISANGIASIAFGADAVASTTNCRITTTDRIIRRVTPGMEMSAVTNT
jgi:hypothetical protein